MAFFNRTFTVLELREGTVQIKDEGVAAMLCAILSQLLPPSEVYSKSIILVPVTFQLIVKLVVESKFSPPLGAKIVPLEGNA